MKSRKMPKLEPVHPGEVLFEEFMWPLNLNAAALARAIRVPSNRVTRLVNGQASVTPDTAMRLSRALRTTPQFWLNLQTQYDLEVAEDAGEDFEGIEPIVAA